MGQHLFNDGILSYNIKKSPTNLARVFVMFAMALLAILGMLFIEIEGAF
jgi:hypothetical protein